MNEILELIFIFHTDTKYNVLVPYAVLQELDGLKRDEFVSSQACVAINFINNELKSDTQRLQGKSDTKNLLS